MRDISVERIKLQNFKCIEDFDLTLDNSLYLVSGRNGSGKTSLFESIYVCLYNRRPNGKPASNVIKKGKDFSEIKLILKVNDALHTITRRIGKGSKFIIETEDGTKIKGNEAKKFIEEIIPQYVVRLSLLQDVDLKDIFTKIIDIEPLVESAHKKSSLVKQKINEYNTKLSQLESEQQRIQFSINDAQQRVNQINQQLQQIANLSVDVDISEEQLFEILEKQKQFNKVYQQLKDELSQKVSLEVNQLWQEQSKISSELHVYQSKINELQNIPTEGTCPLCKQPINEEHAKRFKEEILELEKKSKELSETLNEINVKIQTLNSNPIDNEAYEKAKEKVGITDEELSYDVVGLQKKIAQMKQLESQKDQLIARKEEIENTINSNEILIQEIENNKNNIKKDIEKQERLLELLDILGNRRLLKKTVSNLTVGLLNKILSEITIFNVFIETDDNDNIIVKAINNNGETVLFDDLSQGEQALAKLTLYLAIRKILSENINFKILFFDEFIDHLDPDASAKLLPALKELSNEFKIMLITFNSYIAENDIWDQTLNMEEYH